MHQAATAQEFAKNSIWILTVHCLVIKQYGHWCDTIAFCTLIGESVLKYNIDLTFGFARTLQFRVALYPATANVLISGCVNFGGSLKSWSLYSGVFICKPVGVMVKEWGCAWYGRWAVSCGKIPLWWGKDNVFFSFIICWDWDTSVLRACQSYPEPCAKGGKDHWQYLLSCEKYRQQMEQLHWILFCPLKKLKTYLLTEPYWSLFIDYLFILELISLP